MSEPQALDTGNLLRRLPKPDDARYLEREARDEAKRQEQRIKALSSRLGKRYSPARVSLDTFQVYHADQREALAKLRAFIAAVKTNVDEGKGLVLYGTVGTGKDHLLAAALYAAAGAGVDCSWVNGQEIFSEFRDNMDSGERESALMNRFVAPQVLGISDPIPPVFDASKPNAWRAELLYRVLDSRYRDCKATWVSINAKSPQDADAKLTEPVFDRIQDKAEFIACFWPSFREQR